MKHFKPAIFLFIFSIIFIATMPLYSQTQIKFDEKMIKIRVGDSAKIKAKAIDSEGENIENAEITFSVTPAHLGIINNDEFSASVAGEGQITAQYENTSASLKLIVQEAKAGDDDDDDDDDDNDDKATWPMVKIYPDTLEMEVGKIKEIKSTYIDSTGNRIDTTFTWWVDPQVLGTVDAKGIFSSASDGTGYVFAQLDTLVDSVLVIISPREFESGESWPMVKIHPDTLEMEVGKIKEIKTTYIDFYGHKIDTTFTWWVDPEVLGTVDEKGVFSSASAGTGYVFAQLDTLVDSVLVIISPREFEDGESWPMVKIYPDTLEMEVGKIKEIKTTYIDFYGNKIDTTLTWWVAPDSLGSVNASGEFTALTVGEGYIFAQLDTLIDSVMVMVYPREMDDDDDEEAPFVKILTRKVNLAPADSVQLMAIYVGLQGRDKEAEILWSVNPPELGTINEAGMFYATNPGEGFIIAQKDTLSDSVRVEIKVANDDQKGNSFNNKNRLVISPKDTTLQVGASVQFLVWLKNEDGSLEPTTAEWMLSGDPIGTISEEGLLTVDQAGVGLVRAIKDGKEKTATVIVIDEISETEVLNTITIGRVLDGEYFLPPVQLQEGEAYTIGGLPYPLDILNGGLLYFPVASLHEDIELHVKLPEFVQNDSSDLDLGEGNIAAIEFNVIVNGVHIENYYFDIPLNLSIPFNAELLDSLGIDPLDIGMFFEDNSDFTSNGIQNITIDSTENKIYAQVAHFSTLVVRPKILTTDIAETAQQVTIPTEIALRQNYPNPFNPSTSIDFALPEAENVKLTIFNSLGRHIQTLNNGLKPAGTHSLVWNGKDMNGRTVASGIYFYVLETDNLTLQRKMVFIK